MVKPIHGQRCRYSSSEGRSGAEDSLAFLSSLTIGLMRPDVSLRGCRFLIHLPGAHLFGGECPQQIDRRPVRVARLEPAVIVLRLKD